MIYVVDIDGTICTDAEKVDGVTDYTTCVPYSERIEMLNDLYYHGLTIIYHTARGMGRTNNDAEKAHELFYEFTSNQLKKWGAAHHKLMLGKPAADAYIDDKAIDVNKLWPLK